MSKEQKSSCSTCKQLNDSKNYGRKAIFFVVALLHVTSFGLVIFNPDISSADFLAVWLCGCLLASIELSSKYKDDPAAVLTSSPGLLYLGVNGLICILGLYLMHVFGLGIEVDDSLPLLAQRTMDVLQASLSSFFIMRSSFLKLGHDSQIDLGLNAVLKKLLEIVDREVDRVRAVKRSKDITDLFKNVCHTNTKHVFKLCSNVMQGVSVDEAADLQRKLDELESYVGTAPLMDLNMMQLEIGLDLYNIVGLSVLGSAIKDLNLDKSVEPQSEDSKASPTDSDETESSQPSKTSAEESTSPGGVQEVISKNKALIVKARLNGEPEQKSEQAESSESSEGQSGRRDQ